MVYEISSLYDTVVYERKDWGAKPPLHNIKSMKVPLNHVLMTYTGTEPCDTPEECKKRMKELQEHYQSSGVADVAPNFVVGGDGNVYEGRGWYKTPLPHEKVPNLTGQCLEISHFGKKGDFPPPQNVDALWDLLEYGKANRYVKYIPEYYGDYDADGYKYYH